jgi:hypothetical protein
MCVQACGVGSSIETVNCCEDSFAASPGWDAVTGLGSPNFQVLSNLVLNNATAFPNLGAYPTGNAETASSSGDDDDDSQEKAIRLSALIIAILAFVLGAVGTGIACSQMSKRAMSAQ